MCFNKNALLQSNAWIQATIQTTGTEKMDVFGHCYFACGFWLLHLFKVFVWLAISYLPLDFLLLWITHQNWHFFGHGHLVTYSNFWQKLYSNEKGSKQITKRGKWHAYSTLLVLLLLSGDIQLNPGPVTNLSPVQNVQLKTAETTLVRHVNTGGTEPMDFSTWSRLLIYQEPTVTSLLTQKIYQSSENIRQSWRNAGAACFDRREGTHGPASFETAAWPTTAHPGFHSSCCRL